MYYPMRVCPATRFLIYFYNENAEVTVENIEVAYRVFENMAVS